MAIRKTPFVVGNFYHCYSRGIDKCATFLEDQDYWRFIETIHIVNRQKKIPQTTLKNLDPKSIWEFPREKPLVHVVAYCLMPNHFHLVLKEIRAGGISAFMQKLITAYTMFFNKKYKRSGGLFTRPFRSKHIDDDYYLQHVITYIHLNPSTIIGEDMHDHHVIDHTHENLLTYRFSSLPDYIGQERPQCVVISKALP